MSAFDSAIDDTFGFSAQPRQSEDCDEENLFDNAYIGPRDGHWDVTSSVGSFVDDRCPTVYGSGHRPRGNGHGRHINEGLAKKLMQATIEEKRAAGVSDAKDAASKGEASKGKQSVFAPREAKAPKPKPFVVPPLRNRPYQPVTPDVPKPEEGWTRPTEAKLPRKQAQKMAKAATEPAPAATASKSASAKSSHQMPTGSSIRILGKNGEVAYVNLPSLPKAHTIASSLDERTLADKPAKRSQSTSLHDKQSQSRNRTAGHSDRAGSDQDKSNKSHIETNSVRVSERQDGWASVPPATNSKKSREASPTVMSGALPMPSRAASPVLRSTASSCKDSGIVMGGMSTVVSRANSRKASTHAAGSGISRGALSVARNIASMPAAPGKQPRSRSAASAPRLFEEIGQGVTTGFPPRKKVSERGSEAAKALSIGSRQSSHRPVGRRAPSARSAQQPSKKDATNAGYKPPTVQSASSSSSITHSFGGFLQDSSAQQPYSQTGWDNGREHSVSSKHTQPHQVKDSHAWSRGSQAKEAVASPLAGPRSTPTQVLLDNAQKAFPLSDRGDPPCPSHSPVSPFAQSPVEPSLPPSLSPAGPTKFAGDGWISPHPLSVAATDIGAPPQSAVYIPKSGSGHHDTLTYSQWKAEREMVRSISGSFAGSHVPSAVGLQPVSPAAYNHPPPVGYVGSYHDKTRQFSRTDQQVSLYDPPHWSGPPRLRLPDSREASRSAAARDREPSFHSQDSVYTHFTSPSTAHHNLVYNGSVPRTPCALAPNDAQTPQQSHHGFTADPESTPTPSYVVGLTPTELSKYQQQLGSTISHYSTQLSGLREEQTPTQPNYEVWNSAQSHASRRTASQHSVQPYPPSLSGPREKTVLVMPWDQESRRVSSPTVVPSQVRSQHVASDWGDSHRSGATQVPVSLHSRSHVGGSRSQVSALSVPMACEPQSQVTYGTAEWQDLEDAEDGRGRFESRQSHRMW